MTSIALMQKGEPMSDSIYRHDAIKAIETSRFLIDAIEKVMMLPSAQPKTGKWIDKSGGIEGAWNYCSVCGEQAIDLYDYCPNCGAMMKDGD